MSRKDIIIISALINTGLLAILFVTALKTDENPLPASEAQFAVQEKSDTPSEIAWNEVASNMNMDEVDMVLREYLPESIDKHPPVPASAITMKEPPTVPPQPPQIDEESTATVEVVVKSGDALEKIARANRTTVDTIRKINQLKSDKLKIGQVLKVPVGPIKELKRAEPEKPVAEVESPLYYTVKPGDNPWKIAKMHQVKFEDLLILNHLDEERAKNLKVGDKIRVR